MNKVLYTIGHSNISTEEFLNLLKSAGIEVLADVRTSPYSQYASQFNREILMKAVAESDIKYLYLGDLLGGKPKDESCYINDSPDYDAIRKKDFYKAGIGRLLIGISQYRVAIMCCEEDPVKCHRRNLIGLDMHKNGIKVLHIRGNGDINEDSYCNEESESLQSSLF